MALGLPLVGWTAPQVVVSIAPLHGLVSDLMDGVAEPELIYEGGQSPHASALSPQQLKALVTADLLIWVGPELETSLGRLTHRLPDEAINLSWHDYDADMTVHATREPLFARDEHDDHDDHDSHDDDDNHHDDHGHDHGDLDPHFWLSIDNAQVFVRAVRDQLMTLDAGNAEHYRDNAERLLSELAALETRLEAQLKPVADQPFIVFHDGFQYFERAYGLNALGALVVQPDVPPGPRTVADLIELAKPYGSLCLFHEPQFSDRWLQTLTRSVSDAQVAQIDPLGFELNAGAGHYQALMTQLASDLTHCLESLS